MGSSLRISRSSGISGGGRSAIPRPAPSITANELHLPMGKPLAGRSRSGRCDPRLLGAAAGPEDGHRAGPDQLDVGCKPTGRAPIRACAPSTAAREHAWMRIRAIAQPQAEFDAWLQQQRAAGGAGRRGRDAAARKSSRSAPASTATPSAAPRPQARVGPDLTHFGSRADPGRRRARQHARQSASAGCTIPQAVKPGQLYAQPAPDARRTARSRGLSGEPEMSAHPASSRTRPKPCRRIRSGAGVCCSWVASVDHKQIGILYLLTTLVLRASAASRRC